MSDTEDMIVIDWRIDKACTHIDGKRRCRYYAVWHWPETAEEARAEVERRAATALRKTAESATFATGAIRSRLPPREDDDDDRIQRPSGSGPANSRWISLHP